MKLQIDVHFHFSDVKDLALLLHAYQQARLDLILQTLTKNHKETKELFMKTQAQIDQLTADVEANTASITQALTDEAAEIKQAIESSNIDTAALEAAIAANRELSDKVKKLFTPASTEEPPVDEEPVDEPVEEDPAL